MPKKQQPEAMDVDSSSTSTKKQLPHIEDIRTRVTLNEDAPINTQTFSYSGAFKSLGIDDSFDLQQFKDNFKINIISLDEEQMVFDMIGVDAPIANAFRRILLSEVPTMAIEKVVINNNTSIIQDEVLAHRLGLIPIKADPRKFVFKPKNAPLYNKPNDSLVFKLNVTCTRASKNSSEDYINGSVYSNKLEWVPQGVQAETFKDDPIRPVHNDILLAKLRPGQTIDVECYVEKGIGATHAKWSPVATATYRLLPEILLVGEIKGAHAEELVKKCPMNVYDIEDLGGEKRAYVARPRDCTMCRECIRGDDWSSRIKLKRVKDHFIFSIESTGILRPEDIFKEAIRIFIEKCQSILDHLHKTTTQQ
eukprot:GEZU01030114.1.p1 GENE.GEZU01030114.1~~GEZU01030114.1.p1  ORF type:complete len:380 (-),score=76.18 GEZU01030114.1:121-1212(-)